MQIMSLETELVVLLDEGGKPIGTAEKADVHTRDTALHLAFSCHVYNESGQVLVTRRALSKLTWPGVWTNSFCGHPAPGESFEGALHRRAEIELGIGITDIEPILPDFRYRAIDSSGIVENEICRSIGRSQLMLSMRIQKKWRNGLGSNPTYCEPRLKRCRLCSARGS